MLFVLFTLNCVRPPLEPLLELSFQTHPNSRFLKTLFNQVWSGSTIAPTTCLSGVDTEHLISVETSFLKGFIFDMRDVS